MIVAITVTGKDRPGIISALAGLLYQAGGNLEDTSMTILEGEFAMIVLAALKDDSVCTKLSQELLKLERKLGLTISMKEIKHRLIRGEKHRPGTIPWVVSVLGRDRAGIVYRVSDLLASYGLNITDLNSKIMGRGRHAAYALILEVDIPRQTRLISNLKRNFQTLQKKLAVTIAFHPLEASRF